MRALLLALLLSTPVAAQAPPPAGVDLWASVAIGSLQDEADSPENYLGSLALQAARGRWTARAAYLESSRLELSGGFNWKQAGDRRPDRYHTLMLTAGPTVWSSRFFASATAGPGLTYGSYFDESDGSFRTYGIGVGGQGYARIVGPIWIGADASALVAPGVSHGGVAAALRVDLERSR